MAGKGIDARHEMNASRAQSPAKAADTIRDPCWQRPDLTWEHSLGLSPDAGGTKITLRFRKLQAGDCGRGLGTPQVLGGLVTQDVLLSRSVLSLRRSAS
jgi:hypothetical protein